MAKSLYIAMENDENCHLIVDLPIKIGDFP
jgi:hypothetical protein